MARIGAADIAAMLRREIQRETYRLHDRLPPSRTLAATYGVARNTLRDALSTLETEGLLESRRGSGTYVTYRGGERRAPVIENANPLELMDARFALEPHICRLCVLHGQREDFERIEELCDRMEAAVTDPAAFAKADTHFHAGLASAARNNLLSWIIEQINTVRSLEEWSRMTSITLDEAMIREYNRQHRQILEAIRAREPERAATLMKEHLETARLSLTRAANA